jgi:hypothetical protein
MMIPMMTMMTVTVQVETEAVKGARAVMAEKAVRGVDQPHLMPHHSRM